MRAALTCSRRSIDFRQAAVGCVRGLSCSLIVEYRSSSRVPPPPAGLRMRDDARALTGVSATAPKKHHHQGFPGKGSIATCAITLTKTQSER
ncbi:hypothetical protein EVAR_56232_1 [Eumeta japonica]|uniref:Uncharacterized protein n=1 Tax=Eumeta variegata TaxID=151549 RepID=A0A4C1XJP6_EUMVA|nr:hypothetical protein EVAR_56232_1 [Eumeta japonica]